MPKKKYEEYAYALFFKKSGEMARNLYSDQFLIFGEKSVADEELKDYDTPEEEEYKLEVNKVKITLVVLYPV